jgi:hypothetical protein
VEKCPFYACLSRSREVATIHIAPVTDALLTAVHEFFDDKLAAVVLSICPLHEARGVSRSMQVGTWFAMACEGN